MAASKGWLVAFLVACVVGAAGGAPAQETNGGGRGGPAATGQNGRGDQPPFYYWLPGHRYKFCIGSADGGCGAIPKDSSPTAAAVVPSPEPAPPRTGPARGNGPGKAVAVPRSRPRLPAVAPVIVAGDFVPDEVLVTVHGGLPIARSLAGRFLLRIRSLHHSVLLDADMVRFGIPDGRPVGTVLAQLATDGRVLTGAPNHLYAIQQAAPAPFAFERIALETRSADGDGVRVGVIDTAADLKHAALRGVIAKSFDAWPDMPTRQTDHATSVVGLIAGHRTFQGIAPGARVYLARAFEKGASRMDVLVNALDWLAAQNVRIVNMSFAGPDNRLLALACRNAHEKGMLLIAAAGNEGPKAPPAFPAAYDGVMAVTATDAGDRLMPQANRGDYVFVAAPGVEVMAPIPGGGMDFVTGTSFAAAIVSGAAADLIHAAPARSTASLERALAKSAIDLGPKGRDPDFGYGRIDVSAAAMTQ